jgi:hypothetical protein
MNVDDSGPTGAILRDLPSPYLPHKATGLLHLERFIAKIRKHLAGELPKSYQRNFCRGFDGFLCAHLGIDPKAVVALVKECGDDEALLDKKLLELLPSDLRAHEWNRELVQKGMHGMGRERLQEVKHDMGIGNRDDLISFADMIEFDEGRIK